MWLSTSCRNDARRGSSHLESFLQSRKHFHKMVFKKGIIEGDYVDERDEADEYMELRSFTIDKEYKGIK